MQLSVMEIHIVKKNNCVLLNMLLRTYISILDTQFKQPHLEAFCFTPVWRFSKTACESRSFSFVMGITDWTLRFLI